MGSCTKSPNGKHRVRYVDEEDIYDELGICVWCKKQADYPEGFGGREYCE